jgi:hypothetical protein
MHDCPRLAVMLPFLTLTLLLRFARQKFLQLLNSRLPRGPTAVALESVFSIRRVSGCDSFAPRAGHLVHETPSESGAGQRTRTSAGFPRQFTKLLLSPLSQPCIENVWWVRRLDHRDLFTVLARFPVNCSLMDELTHRFNDTTPVKQNDGLRNGPDQNPVLAVARHPWFLHVCTLLATGGGYRGRTCGLMLAKHALSRLS